MQVAAFLLATDYRLLTTLRSRPNRRPAALAGADADAVVQWQNKYLAVADLARLRRPGGVDDGLHCRLHERLVDGDLQFQLRQQSHVELGTAIQFGEAALPAAAAHVRDRH